MTNGMTNYWATLWKMLTLVNKTIPWYFKSYMYHNNRKTELYRVQTLKIRTSNNTKGMSYIVRPGLTSWYFTVHILLAIYIIETLSFVHFIISYSLYKIWVIFPLHAKVVLIIDNLDPHDGDVDWENSTQSNLHKIMLKIVL